MFAERQDPRRRTSLAPAVRKEQRRAARATRAPRSPAILLRVSGGVPRRLNKEAGTLRLLPARRRGIPESLGGYPASRRPSVRLSDESEEPVLRNSLRCH